MADWRQELTTRLDGLGLRPEHEADIVDELSEHLEDHVREQIAGGATDDEARASALADLDAPGELRRRLAGILTPQPLNLPPPGTPMRGRWLAARWQDVRYAVRSLRRSPVFSATVIGTLALTIGPTTAMLSIGNWLLWRPTPGISEPDRLAVARFGRTASGGAPFGPNEMTVIAGLSYPNLEDVRTAATTFTGIAGYLERAANVAATDRHAEVAGTGWVTAGFFEVLGVRPVAGRTFAADDDRWPDGARVAVISDGLALRAFGGSDAAIDGRLVVNGVSVHVVGVLPPEFTGTGPMSRIDLWVPGASYNALHHWTRDPATARQDDLFDDFVVRLAPGSSVAAVQAELDHLLATLAERYPEANEQLAGARSSVTPGIGLHPRSVDRYRRMIAVLMAIGGVLLLLGCANVANLLLARGQRLHVERRIRLALGASRGRLAMLPLTESTLLAIAGGSVGALLAVWLKDFVVAMLVPQSVLGTSLAVPLDGRVLGLTTLVCVACGLATGLAPAIVGAIRDAGLPVGRRQHLFQLPGRARRTRVVFAAAELALSLALVISAVLLVATLRTLSSTDPGFEVTGVTLHQLDASNQGYDGDRVRLYYRELYERVRASLPDAQVALSDSRLGSNSRIRVEDPRGGEPLRVWSATSTGDYFDALGLRLIEGRPLTDDEALRPTGGGPTPVVISDVLARHAFGDASALGRQLVLPATTQRPAEPLTVIGVVAGAQWTLGLPSFGNPTGGARMEVYLPFDRSGSATAVFDRVDSGAAVGSAALIVRSSLPLAGVAAVVQAASAHVDPSLPVQASLPLVSEIENRLAERITFAWVSSLLGWLGFVLAAVGLYGLLAQSVAERTREFGIRMAIGGARRHVVGLVLRQAGWIAGVGTIAGIGLALWGTRLIEAQLVGVTRTSPIVYAAAAAALAAVVLFASIWPARTATRIEPVDALREP